MAANLFISHTAVDKDVAAALGEALDRLFRGQVTASYSTKRGEDAIKAGENWFDWIGRQVRTSQVTVVLLTPNSVNKKWVLWETGAIYGAATALEGGLQRRLRPLLFRLEPEDMPAPLQSANLQALRGDNRDQVKEFLTQLVGDLGGFSGDQLIRLGEQMPAVVLEFGEKVTTALARVPTTPLEANVEAIPSMTAALKLTITAIQALNPSVKINGRYFHAVCEDDRDYLDRAEAVYVESEWMQELGLRRVDVQKDTALVICQSYVQRTPIYKVLDEEDRRAYREEITHNIDPEQSWVLACPVMVRDGKPLGVICLYGKKPVTRAASGIANLKRVSEMLAGIIGQTLDGTSVAPGQSLPRPRV